MVPQPPPIRQYLTSVVNPTPLAPLHNILDPNSLLDALSKCQDSIFKIYESITTVGLRMKLIVLGPGIVCPLLQTTLQLCLEIEDIQFELLFSLLLLYLQVGLVPLSTTSG